MKKKIILIFSMVLLCVSLFAIGISASSTDDCTIYVAFPSYVVDDVTLQSNVQFAVTGSDGHGGAIYNYSYELVYKDETRESLAEFYVYGENQDSDYVYGVNLKFLRKHLISKSISDLDSFGLWIDSINLDSCDPGRRFMFSLVDMYNESPQSAYDFVFNFSETIGFYTEEDLTTQYNQGKTDGVTEYKESEEYSSTLQSEYTKGYGVGYEAYKDSAEYESALNIQFNLGSSTGVKNYLESEEYSNALQNEYDNGYEAATTEDNQKEAKNMLGTALGISGSLIIVLLCIYFFVGRKAKKRR